jgi:hypothetical protein
MLPPHLPQNLRRRPIKLKFRKPAPRKVEVTHPIDRKAVKNIRLKLRRRPAALKPELRVLEQA